MVDSSSLYNFSSDPIIRYALQQQQSQAAQPVNLYGNNGVPVQSSPVARMAAIKQPDAEDGYTPTSGAEMEADTRSSVGDLMNKLMQQRAESKAQDRNQQWMSFFGKLASSTNPRLLGALGESSNALAETTGKQAQNNTVLDQAALQEQLKAAEWQKDQQREQQLADQTGVYQTGQLKNQSAELGLKQQELQQNIANQLAERQKPIPDGYGGFIVPNPKDPTSPLRIAGPLDRSNGTSLMNAYNKAPLDSGGQPITGDAYLATLPPSVADLTKRIGDSKMQVTPYMMGNRADPSTKAAIAAVTKYNPDWNQNSYGQIIKFNTDPNGGVKAKALDTIAPHLQMLGDLTDAMKTGDVTMVNSIRNKLATDYGVTFDNGLSDAANLKAAQQLVGNEIINSTLAQGKGGALGDREEIAKNLNNATNPEILKSNIDNVYKPAIRAQANALEQYYKVNTGQKNFRNSYLLPQTSDAIWGDSSIGKSGADNTPSTARKPLSAFGG